MRTHQRVIVTKPGEIDTLQLITEPLPEPQSREVRVRIETAGVSWVQVAWANAPVASSAQESTERASLEFMAISASRIRRGGSKSRTLDLPGAEFFVGQGIILDQRTPILATKRSVDSQRPPGRSSNST